jgi:hypothetical protein
VVSISRFTVMSLTPASTGTVIVARLASVFSPTLVPRLHDHLCQPVEDRMFIPLLRLMTVRIVSRRTIQSSCRRYPREEPKLRFSSITSMPRRWHASGNSAAGAL